LEREKEGEADVVVILFGFVLKHRFLSNRRGRRMERPKMP